MTLKNHLHHHKGQPPPHHRRNTPPHHKQITPASPPGTNHLPVHNTFSIPLPTSTPTTTTAFNPRSHRRAAVNIGFLSRSSQLPVWSTTLLVTPLRQELPRPPAKAATPGVHRSPTHLASPHTHTHTPGLALHRHTPARISFFFLFLLHFWAIFITLPIVAHLCSLHFRVALHGHSKCFCFVIHCLHLVCASSVLQQHTPPDTTLLFPSF